MTRQIPLPILVAALLAVAPPAIRAADTEHLRFLRPIGIAPRGAEELVAVRLDAPVLAATADDHADLRVLDGGGREVSRVIRPAAVVSMGKVRTSFAVDAPRLRPLPGGGLEIEFTVDAGKHPDPIDGIRIDTPLRNFEQRVQVHRLDDSGTWRPVGDDTLLYDYSQFMDTRQLDVAFPREPRQRPGGTWRVTVDDTTVEQQSTLAELVRTLEGGAETGRREKILVARQPFRIDAIRAWRSDDVAEIRGAAAVEHPVADFRVEEETKEQRTRIRVTSGREPITAFRLTVGERNFGRAVRVERPAADGQGRAGRPPVVLGSGFINRVELRGIDAEETLIQIAQTRLPAYEIVIDNGDSPPLSITGVIAVGDLMRTGQTVQFHVRDAATAHEDLLCLLARDDGAATPAGALVFTCNGRGTRLFSEPDHDARCLRDALGDVPAAGFFAQGEIGPIGRRNFLHGFTASIALFERSEG